MTLDTRPRCLLFVPAIKVERFSKRLDLYDIDGVIFDLEDSVAAGNKVEARNMLREYLSHNRPDTNIYIRPNSVGSPYFEDDMEMILRASPDAVLVSKIDEADEVKIICDWLDRYELQKQKPIGFFPAIETLAGYRNRDKILDECRGRAFLFTIGYEDLCAELGIDRPDLSEPNPLTIILMELAISAKMHGIPMIDSVSRKFQSKDLNDFLKEVNFGKSIGLYGKVAIHPNQIDIINHVYCKEDLVQKETRTVQRFYDLDDGSAVVVNQNGEMEDTPSLERAKVNISQFRR